MEEDERLHERIVEQTADFGSRGRERLFGTAVEQSGLSYSILEF